MLLVILKELSCGAHDPPPKGTRLSLCGDESHDGLEILLALEVLVVKASDITDLDATTISNHIKVATEIYHITDMCLL